VPRERRIKGVGSRPFLVAAALALAAVPAAAAKQNIIVVVEAGAAAPGDTITVRTSSTPRDYVPPPYPGGPRLEVLFVPFDRVLRASSWEPIATRVAVLPLDLRYRGTVSFRLPELPAGVYGVRVRLRGNRDFDYGWATRTVRVRRAPDRLNEPALAAAAAALVASALAWRTRRRLSA
jgi:hypothetical protein